MIVGAMGDAHGGKFFEDGMAERLEGVDLLLLAGDIADSNDLEGFARVLGPVKERYDGRIVAVFGNDEYEQDRPAYRGRFDAIFLDDEAVDLRIDGRTVRVVGTSGSLDRPTWWQRTHIPDIGARYKHRVEKVSGLLERGRSDVLILLSHYVPTYLTLEGERPKAFPEMGSKAMEKVLLERRPDLAIHAHAHAGSPHAVLKEAQGRLDRPAASVPIWNVSLPLNKEVVRLEMDGTARYEQVRH
jgi:Icc-related predicted phosphoesterase